MPHNSYPDDFSVDEINEALGRQKYPPTDEQADIIQAKLEPQLVVAGAGAGKTETMAARAVFLVANGWVSTDQILGLTFTRKAAGELNARIRHRLNQLADSGLIPSNDPRRKTIRNSQQTVLTYDSFMQKIIHEFGLLLPIEPAAQVADQPEKWLTASRVISDLGYKDESGSYTFSKKDSTARECMLDLSEAMDNHLATPEEVREESQALYDNLMNAEDNLNKKKFLRY
ncbi:MAG: UvrD-helicase domain-containing protein [Corynebacterium kroppenstedtii]|nr:UvrD-helicase domain-containing protein [Corynebacterium kroppenstedtii]